MFFLEQQITEEKILKNHFTFRQKVKFIRLLNIPQYVQVSFTGVNNCLTTLLYILGF